MASTYQDGVLKLYAGDNWSEDFTYLGDLTGRTKLWFTIKTSTEDVDAAALVQIEETAGLEYIDGAAAATPANGSINVTNITAGHITVELEAVESVKLTDAFGKCYMDIKWADVAGDVWTLRRKKVIFTPDVTRAVS